MSIILSPYTLYKKKWNPLDDTNLVSWVDPTTNVGFNLLGNLVLSLTDKKGVVYSADNSGTAPIKESDTVNFQNTSVFLSTNNNFNFSNKVIIVTGVYRDWTIADSPSNDWRFFQISPVNGRAGNTFSLSSNPALRFNNGNVIFNSISYTKSIFCSVGYVNQSFGNNTLRVNGNEPNTISTTNPDNILNLDNVKCYLGRGFSPSSTTLLPNPHFLHDWTLTAVSDDANLLPTIRLYEGFFAHKHNLVSLLPSNHPYKNSAP